MKRNISKTLLAVIAASTFAAVGATAAHADQTNPKPFRVQVGAFWPNNGTIKDLTANTQFGGGAAYDVVSPKVGQNALPIGVYVDFGTVKKHGYDLSTVGGGVEGRYYFSPAESTTQPYFGLGVGGYNVHSDYSGSKDDFKFGGKATLGIETTSGGYLEGGYTFIAKAKLINEAQTLDPSGATLDLGYRF
jgi:hypothetical protein